MSKLNKTYEINLLYIYYNNDKKMYKFFTLVDHKEK
jgi:hypothetical protein